MVEEFLTFEFLDLLLRGSPAGLDWRWKYEQQLRRLEIMQLFPIS